MKVIVFLVCLVLFIGSFALFGYAFAFEGPWDILLFSGGIVAVAASLAIPFHLLGKLD